jgi:histidine triad (HIT) family protein
MARLILPIGLPSAVGRSGRGVVDDCLFCRIVAGEVPADVVHSSDRVVAFRDIAAQAPTHVLVVPREHHRDAAALAQADPAATAELLTAAAAVAEAEGHTDYRLVFNTGPGVGQTVFHTHLHVLAGRPMTWPPG